MENLMKILPVIIIIVIVFFIREGLSIYGYFKYCKLHEASKKGNADKVRKLLEEGYAVNILDPRLGLTPLHYAVRNGHLEVAGLLIEKGAKLTDHSLQGITPQNWASEYLTQEQQDELLRMASDEDDENPDDVGAS